MLWVAASPGTRSCFCWAQRSGVPSGWKKRAKGCEMQGKEAVAHIVFTKSQKQTKASIARAGWASFWPEAACGNRRSFNLILWWSHGKVFQHIHVTWTQNFCFQRNLRYAGAEDPLTERCKLNFYPCCYNRSYFSRIWHMQCIALVTSALGIPM